MTLLLEALARKAGCERCSFALEDGSFVHNGRRHEFSEAAPEYVTGIIKAMVADHVKPPITPDMVAEEALGDLGLYRPPTPAEEEALSKKNARQRVSKRRARNG